MSNKVSTALQFVQNNQDNSSLYGQLTTSIVLVETARRIIEEVCPMADDPILIRDITNDFAKLITELGHLQGEFVVGDIAVLLSEGNTDRLSNFANL